VSSFSLSSSDKLKVGSFNSEVIIDHPDDDQIMKDGPESPIGSVTSVL